MAGGNITGALLYLSLVVSAGGVGMIPNNWWAGMVMCGGGGVGGWVEEKGLFHIGLLATRHAEAHPAANQPCRPAPSPIVPAVGSTESLVAVTSPCEL